MGRIRTHRPNHRLVKVHRNYTVEETALLFDIHKNTVRTWLKEGLPACDEMRPLLILGRELIAFLRSRKAAKKQPCAPGEIYCLRCRVPRIPAGQMADFEQTAGAFGNIVGICPDCGAMIYRRASFAKLELVRGNLDITIVEGG